jgi:hypothetical protein
MRGVWMRSLIILSHVEVGKNPATLGTARGVFSNMRLFEPKCPESVSQWSKETG